MNEANIVQRAAFWVSTQWSLLKCAFGHDARGPIEGIEFEISPGKWHPYYQCRNCGKVLKWQANGGFKADC
jgi:hypothetical protein